MKARNILIDLENKSVRGIDVYSESYSCWSGDEKPKMELQGSMFNSTRLTKEERKAFKEVANKLIDIYDRQTLDEEVKDFVKLGTNAEFGLPLSLPQAYQVKVTKEDLLKAIDWPKANPAVYPFDITDMWPSLTLNSHYCKADCDLIYNINKLSKSSKPSLDKIYINPDKEIVTAKKDNGDIIKVQNSHGDEFDPYIGAALAYCYKQFGSKAAFRKAVDKITPKPKKKKKVVKHDAFPETETDVIEDLRKGIESFGNFVSSLSDAIHSANTAGTITAEDKIWKEIDGEMVECEVIKQDKYEVGDIVLIRKDLHEGHNYDIYCNKYMKIYSGNIYKISDKYTNPQIEKPDRIVYMLANIDSGARLNWEWTVDMFAGKVVPKK